MFSLSEKLYLLIGGRQEDAYRKEATECSYVPSREAFDKVLEDPYPVLKRRIQYCQDVICYRSLKNSLYCNHFTPFLPMCNPRMNRLLSCSVPVVSCECACVL